MKGADYIFEDFKSIEYRDEEGSLACLKDILNDPVLIDLIEQENWKRLYRESSLRGYTLQARGSLTKMLFDCGVTPKELLDSFGEEIPSGTFSHLKIDATNMTIPEGVCVLKVGCFEYSELDCLVLPSTLMQLERYSIDFESETAIYESNSENDLIAIDELAYDFREHSGVTIECPNGHNACWRNKARVWDCEINEW